MLIKNSLASKRSFNILFRVLAIIWSLVMAYLLLSPGRKGARYFLFAGEDMLAHLGVFAIWSGLVALSFGIQQPSKIIFWKVLIGAFFFGGITELAQYFIPLRQADWWDLVMNISGTLLGFVIVNFAKKELTRTEKKFDK